MEDATTSIESRGWRFHHIGIAVNDLVEGMAAYRLLGFAIGHEEEVAEQGVRVCLIPTGRPDEFVELIMPLADNGVRRFLERRGEGIHHIAFAVDDLAAELAYLGAQGVRLVDSAPRAGAHGWRVAFVHPQGARGALIELVQP
jgi:methylmalonyl-CoA/ethylmalonyl-CoA epimerase